MALGTEERIQEILKLLQNDQVTTVVLDGERGVGKTWTAKQISMKKDSIHNTLWLYLNKKYESGSLHEKISRQLSLFSIYEEWEDDDEEEEAEAERLENLRHRVSVKLKELRSAACKDNKLFLLILDDVPQKQDVEKIMQEVYSLLGPNGRSTTEIPEIPEKIKVLITRSESGSRDTTERMNQEIEIPSTTLYKIIDPLSMEEAMTLLREKIENARSFEILSKAIVEMSKCVPAVIITIAEALNYFGDHGSTAVSSLESVLEEAAFDGEAAIKLLFRSWYDTLESDALTDCFWHSMQLLSKHAGVHYNELITHWIMEGYVGCVGHIEKAYEQGHYVLMELIHRGMLRKQEDNIVIMEGVVLSITDHRRCGFNGTARLGLANVFEDGNWEGLGRLTHTDGMIKSPCSHKTWEKVSTLLMDGHCLDRKVPQGCFQLTQKLQVFTIFNPRFTRFRSLPLPLTSTKNLSILVLRSCDLLEYIDHIRELVNLCVLEISGATLLEKIPDDLFVKMRNLRSLNLSEAKIKSLPSSLFKKSELRWLVLKGCAQLETLPSLLSFENLQVLDLSGATSFKKFQDKTFARLKKLQTLDLSNSQISRLPFLHNLGELTRILLRSCASLTRLPSLNTVTQLQILDLSGATGLKEIQDEPLDSLKVLDLSETQISRLPSSIKLLSDLHLRDCSELVKLPLTKEIKGLELLDLSGSINLAEIEDKSLQDMRYLQVLNFSKVKVKELPSLSNLPNLRQLLLKDCSFLEKLPEMEGLKRLQELNLSGCVALVDLSLPSSHDKLKILDASGCTALKGIQDKSFENMSYIHTLNLSDTKIEFLPSLCNSSTLCHLILTSCKDLKKLPPLEHLSNLEKLNLSGAISLVDFKADFLEHMPQLQILDLSGTPLTKLPSMSKLIKLRQLSLKGCSFLGTVEHLEALTLLEILDLSGTAIRSLPHLNTFSNLCQLLLKDCSQIEELHSLESLSLLEVLDLSGTRMKKFPYEISELTHLKRLDLPDLRGMHDIDLGKIKCIPLEFNWDQCGLFKCAEMFVDSDKPSISVRGSEIFPLLDKDPKFWATKFKKFHFSVFKKQGEDGDINCCKNELLSRDVYFHTRHFYFPKEPDRSLEIHGSYSLPHGFESVLKHADYIYLVDNDLLSCLSNLGADNVKEMKGCWIERCKQMCNILSGGEADVILGRSLEILWISNLPTLSSLYNGNVQAEGFMNLKHLYLDCCPMIRYIFPSSQLAENLETLHVQFCDTLQTLFKCDTPSGYTLKNLKTLYLLELPELTSIGIELPAQLTPKVIECPNLPKLQPEVVD